MAIKWSGNIWIGSGSTYVRLGLEMTYSPTSVTTSTTSVTVSWALILEMVTSGGFASGNDNWSVTGDITGSGQKSWSLNGAGDRATIASGTKSFNLVYGSTQNVDVVGNLIDIGPGGNDGSVALTLVLPARPYAPPAAPTGLSVSRVSDTQQNLSWTRTSTTAAPVQNIEVSRRPQGGSFSTVATIGNLASYSDTKTAGNNEYEYRVRATNSAGASAWSPTFKIDTTPTAPGKPSVQKQINGDILITRPTLAGHATHWEVWHAADGIWDAAPLRGTGGTLGGLLTAGTSSYTHPAPNASQTHQYRVKAVTDSPVLYSAYSAGSDVVQLQAPPNAPTTTGPTTARNAAALTYFTWKHNPVDTTPQTAYELRWRLVGATLWNGTGKVSSTFGGHTYPGGTFTNGTVIEWQVRTWGAHADPGSWSPLRTLRLSAPPVASFVSPGTTWGSSTLVVSWTYSDPEGTAQAAWRVRLWSGGEVVDERSGTGSTTQTTFPVDDGTAYSVDLLVTDGHGVSSSLVTTGTTVVYAPPPVPTLAAVFHPEWGYTEITVDAPAPGAGQVAVASLEIERFEAGRWIVVTSGLDVGSTFVDMVPTLGTLVDYRVRAISALPSTSLSDVQTVNTKTGYVFFNYGPGFGTIVRLWGNLDADQSQTRKKELHHFTDREDPVEFAGRSVTRSYSVTGYVAPPQQHDGITSSEESFLALAKADAPICLRDPEAVKLFCSVSAAPISGHLTMSRSVSIAATRVAWSEEGNPQTPLTVINLGNGVLTSGGVVDYGDGILGT